MLFTVSAKASSFGGFPNVGSTKTLLLSASVKSHKLTLLYARIVSSWLGLSIPDHEVTPKNRATTIYYINIVFCNSRLLKSVTFDKN